MENEIQPDAIPAILDAIIGDAKYKYSARDRLSELFGWVSAYLQECQNIIDGRYEWCYEESTKHRVREIIEDAQGHGIVFVDDEYIDSVINILEGDA